MIKNKLLTISSVFVLVASLIAGMILEDDLSSKLFEVITVLTAVVGAVALFIQFKKDKQINEASFLMDFSASFYDRYECAELVSLLDEYAVTGKQFSYADNTGVIVRYMQWVEAIGSIITSGTVDIESIDQVLGYRFFIATNNKILQDNELIPYRFDYMGTFELYEIWYDYRKKHKLPIPLEENSLHLSPFFKEVRDREKGVALTFNNKRRREVKKSMKKKVEKKKYYKYKRLVNKLIKDKYDMSALENLYHMDDKDINKFAFTLACAFKGYALFEYFASYKYNEKKMIEFWKVMLKASKKRALYLATDESCESVAVVFEPKYKGPNIFSYIRYGGLKLIFKFGLFSVKRMAKFEKFANRVKKEFVKNNTWYFYSLAVNPNRQGQGEASRLVRPLLQFWKDNNQTCYLETLNETNVNIYEHYGFNLVATTFVPNSELTLYGMINE